VERVLRTRERAATDLLGELAGRLGEHTGHEAFRFVEDLPREKAFLAESIFHFASQKWQPEWPQQSEQFVALTSRLAQLEAEVRDHAPAFVGPVLVPAWTEMRLSESR